MQRIRTIVVNHLWWLVLIVAVVMLVAHGFGVRRFVVDNTSLVLLILVLLSPFVAAIKKIKIGEFEAEIEPEEVRRAARQAEKAVPEPSLNDTSEPESRAKGAAIRTLAETDPVVALAKLRIEIEAKLRRLHDRPKQDIPLGITSAPLARVIRDLATAGDIDPKLSSALRSVVAICNRAIHGEDIREVDARQIIDAGIDLIEDLDRRIREDATVHPLEKSVITPGELDGFRNARYRLTTIIPLVDKPERHVYVMTQDELDTFFDGYSEFAEFAVALEMLS
jgi:hypothetical protein